MVVYLGIDGITPNGISLIEVEKDVAVLKNDVSYIKEELNREFTAVKDDLTIIKQKLLAKF
ncbi:hypothetical protein HYY69_07595 [Candidatus Woesearchaeota archaeon]|nr:hypothetical protein [Candidatus Woesearchaeota archaeon]